jgi:hypothetical protein
VDPGTTTSIATLNLRGEVIDLFSSKNMGLRKTIRYLISQGKVSVVASDVTPCPDFVSKVATKLGAKVFTPEESLLVQEKILLTKKYKTQDNHQRDSLAAALAAFHSFKQKFQKIDAHVTVADKIKDEIKHLVLQGMSITKARAKVELLKEESTNKDKKNKEITTTTKKKDEETLRKEVETRSIITQQKRREIKRLEKQVSRMKKEMLEREKEINHLKGLIRKIKKDYSLDLKKEEEIEKRERTINHLKNLIRNFEENLKQIDNLKVLWQKTAKNNIAPVTVFPNQSKIVYVTRRLKARDFEKLKEVEVAFTQDEKNINLLKEKGILIADLKYLHNTLDFYYVYVSDLKQIKEQNRKQKEEMEEEENEQSIPLERIVESYRKNRIRKNEM